MSEQKTIGWTPGPLRGAFFVPSAGAQTWPPHSPGWRTPVVAPALPQAVGIPLADSR